MGALVSGNVLSDEASDNFGALDRKIYDISFLLSNGKSVFGETVIIQGVLWRLDYTLFYLFPDIDTALKLDLDKAVFLNVEEEYYDQMDNLSGCYVVLVGDVSHPDLTRGRVVISKVESYRRGGYLGAKEFIERENNPEFPGYKCEMDVFLEIRD